jgi:hypothetical protein
MKKAHTDIENAIVHIDCYEPRREQVRSIAARFPREKVTLFQYEFRRGPGALPEDFFEAIESLRIHVQQKIVFIVSAQVFDKEDCRRCIVDISTWQQNIRFLIYSCLERDKIRQKYKDLLLPVSEKVDYVEYDVERKERYGDPSFAEAILQRKIKSFLFSSQQ